MLNAISSYNMNSICEFLSMQVNLLEETEDGDLNMFVHHEVPLADFPLCTAWMDFNLKGGDKGKNFGAVCVLLDKQLSANLFRVQCFTCSYILFCDPFFIVFTSGNFVAVGTMDPAIEIWDLDIVMFLETYNTVFLYSHQLLDCKAINDSGIWCYVTGR